MIPEKIDALALIQDLNEWGWRTSKIEIACGWSDGYIATLRKKPRRQLYENAAKLHNLHEAESERRKDEGVELSP